MTVAQIKEAILSIAKTAEICDAYQSVLLASTEQDIINAGINYIEWAYRTNIIDDTLIAEFNQPNLIVNQIYLTGIHILNNPINPVYVFGSANVTINLTGNASCSFLAFSNSVINVNLSNQTFIKGKIFKAELNLNAVHDSSTCLEITDSQLSQIETYNNSVCHIKSYENSIINLLSYNSSYMLINAFFNSILTGIQSDLSIINIITNQQAQNNVISP